MPLETLIQFANKVSDLPDKPNTQMSAEELKAQFDAAPEELRGKYNDLVNVLKGSVAGDSGAENIGSANISGVAGNTVHGQLKDVFDQLKNVVLDQIPNKTITREKFADGAVDFSPVQLEIANLNLQLEASQLVPGGKTYGWTPTTSFGVIVDFTKGKTTAQLNAGDTSLEGKVTMSQGTFVAGKKVTVIGRNPADDSIVKEQATITSISPLTISPLVNSYKTGAWIKRTTANNTTNGLKFGGVDDSVTNTITDTTVVGSSYQTITSARPQALSNGWIVASAFDSTNKIIYFYVSKDNGSTYTQLCKLSAATYFTGEHSLSIKGTKVYVLAMYSADTVMGFCFDASTQTNVEIYNTNRIIVDQSQSAIGKCSLAINEAGTELHAAWASKNTTYPNSFNIRYAKGTINADGTVTWGSVTQVTSVNTTGTDLKNPCIQIRSNGLPIIVSDRTLSGSNNIHCHYFDGSTWVYKEIYNGGSYAQSSPSAIFVPQSVNGLANGRIWVAWHGRDSVDTTTDYIRYAYSDDGGATWSTMVKLYAGLNASITANKNNDIFILYNTTSNGIRKTAKTSANSSFSSAEVVPSTGVNPSALYEPNFDFSSPLFIYKDTNNSKIGFYGTWTIGVEAPITENTLRLTLTQQAKEVMTYLHHTAGLTATAQVNGNVMDKTTTAEETQFTRVLGSLQDIEIEITLTRNSINDDITIDKILGGVA